MKRRSFFRASAGTAAGLTGLTGCGKKNKSTSIAPSVTDSGTLSGMTLNELRDWYRKELFEEFLPFFSRNCIDHEYGGFMIYLNRDGTRISYNKRGWWEGRGIWVFSFLYNKLGRNPDYLEAARKSVEFIMKHKPEKGGLWPELYSREGKVLKGPDYQGFANLFIANGLAEYSKACGDEQYWHTAKEILIDFIRYYDSENFFDRDGFFPRAKLDIKGPPRMVGTWMVLIRAITQMLESTSDPELAAVADRCVDAIFSHHLNPEFDLTCEYLNHDMSRPESDDGQIVTGHAYEILWMMMCEALRRNDKELFSTSLRLFRRHVTVFWDDVYEGVFHRLDHVDRNEWKDLTKLWWSQEEVLIGTLIALEHTGDQWAKDWFARAFTLIREKRKITGSPLWLMITDRKHKNEKFTHAEHFHHIRCLALNLLTLERMIERGGRPSGQFI